MEEPLPVIEREIMKEKVQVTPIKVVEPKKEVMNYNAQRKRDVKILSVESYQNWRSTQVASSSDHVFSTPEVTVTPSSPPMNG